MREAWRWRKRPRGCRRRGFLGRETVRTHKRSLPREKGKRHSLPRTFALYAQGETSNRRTLCPDVAIPRGCRICWSG
jgi:hypothetical protein